MCATSGDGRPGNVGPTSAHGRIGRGPKVDVELTLGQRMHFECAQRQVMVSRATLAQRRHMGGLVVPNASTSNQRWDNVYILSVLNIMDDGKSCDVGPTSAQCRPNVDPTSAQRWPNVGSTLAQRRLNVGPMLAQRWPNVGLISAQCRLNVGPTSAHLHMY